MVGSLSLLILPLLVLLLASHARALPVPRKNDHVFERAAHDQQRRAAFLRDAALSRLASTRARLGRVGARAYPSPPTKTPVNPSGMLEANPRKGQPAQFDPLIMAAAQTAMMIKARGPASQHPDPANQVGVVQGGLAAPGVPIHPGNTMGGHVMGGGVMGAPADAPLAPNSMGGRLGGVNSGGNNADRVVSNPQSPVLNQLLDATNGGQGKQRQSCLGGCAQCTWGERWGVRGGWMGRVSLSLRVGGGL